MQASFSAALSARYVGCAGPSVSTKTRKTTNTPTVAKIIVSTRTMPNWTKKRILHASKSKPVKNVVAADERMGGPMLQMAPSERSVRGAAPEGLIST